MNTETIEWQLLIPAGEEVLWEGRPRHAFYSLILAEFGFVKKVDTPPVDTRVLYMYGLLFGGGILFLLGWVWWTILWAMILIQVFFLTDFYRYYCASKTHYAYTAEAVYIYTFGWSGHQLHRIPLDGIWEIKYVEWPDKVGEIYFFCIQDPPVISKDFRTGNTRFNPTFDQIPEVRAVCEALRSIWLDLPKMTKQEPDDTEVDEEKVRRARRSMVPYALVLVFLSFLVTDYYFLDPVVTEEQIILSESVQSDKSDRTYGIYVTDAGRVITNNRYLYRDYLGQVVIVQSSAWMDTPLSVVIGEREYFIGSHMDGWNRIMGFVFALWILVAVALGLHFLPGVGQKRSDLLLQIHIVSIVLFIIFGMLLSIIYYLRV